MRNVGVVAALGLTCALTLPACAGGKPTKSTTLASAMPKPRSTSPAVVGGRADVPAAAKQHTRVGAESYVRYYFDMINVAATTGDPSVLDGLGGSRCQFCDRVQKMMQDQQYEGEHYLGDVVEIREIGPHGNAPEGEEYFKVHFVQFGTRKVNADGEVVDTDPKIDRTYYGRTIWDFGQWYFMGLQRSPG